MSLQKFMAKYGLKDEKARKPKKIETDEADSLGEGDHGEDSLAQESVHHAAAEKAPKHPLFDDDDDDMC